jgi:redox-sensitive bicupin YhaK (pirin superfamily)
LHQSLPQTWNAFAYVLEGAIQVFNGDAEAPSRSIGQFHMAVFEQEGDSVSISVSADANFILVAGLPLDQPIVQYGPFVGTSREEVAQAVRDFRRGENGFERAVGWVSENSRSRRNSVVV